jgi:NADH:ubiquinone oxidoreductase subunit 2 (subunit N)
MLVFFARDALKISSKELGFVYAGAAVAQILIILLVPVLSKKGKSIKIMLLNLIISSLGIILVSMSWNWVSLTIGMAIQSAPVIMFNVLNRTLRQMIVPNYIYGRVNGIVTMLSLGTLPLSGFLTGVFAGYIEIKYIFLFLGLFSLVIALKFSMSPLRNYYVDEYYNPELSNGNVKRNNVI